MCPDTGVYEIFMEGLCSYPLRSELWLVLSASRRHCFNLKVQRWDLTGSYQSWVDLGTAVPYLCNLEIPLGSHPIFHSPCICSLAGKGPEEPSRAPLSPCSRALHGRGLGGLVRVGQSQETSG